MENQHRKKREKRAQWSGQMKVKGKRKRSTDYQGPKHEAKISCPKADPGKVSSFFNFQEGDDISADEEAPNKLGLDWEYEARMASLPDDDHWQCLQGKGSYSSQEALAVP